jgi:4-alpha-glucanotransferase
MPGMRILQFGFGGRGSHVYLPHRFVPNTVVYTGTHDNNTTLGWWREDCSAEERASVQTYLRPIQYEGDIVWAMMRAAACSVANVCIFPLQDILHLGGEARMNTPAAAAGNWSWRYHPQALHPDFAAQLTALMQVTDRDGYEQPIEGAEAGKPTDEASTREKLGDAL